MSLYCFGRFAVRSKRLCGSFGLTPYRAILAQSFQQVSLKRDFSQTKKEKKKHANNKYSHTLNLPNTSFPLRAHAAEKEPHMVEHIADQLYYWQRHVRGKDSESPLFVLHDGPPYANGDLHMGHAMNKVLKDIINRYKLMRGFEVRYVPGWDCHGLPIELKALEQLRKSTKDKAPPGSDKRQPNTSTNEEDSSSMDAITVRKLAQRFAAKAIEGQKKDFRRWGVMADWESIYTTMDRKYEGAQLDVFLQMVRHGVISRGLKPVHWSPSSQTALAEAELEYKDDHLSIGCMVAFRTQESRPRDVIIWTTTPWTIPANMAVAYHKDIEYCEVVPESRPAPSSEDPNEKPKFWKTPFQSLPMGLETRGDDIPMVVATECIPALEEYLGGSVRILNRFPGSDLAGVVCKHPLFERESPLLAAEHVEVEAGTGLVHTAPGHGVEDFHLGKEHGIEAVCPVDAKGCYDFTKSSSSSDNEKLWNPRIGCEGLIDSLEGVSVLGKGTTNTLESLLQVGALVGSRPYFHRYPYDWRTKKPVIFRATEQWFAQLDRLKKKAVSELENVVMIPESGRHRLTSMVSSRSEWCISRQRSWGIPIPAFYHKETGEAIMTEEIVEHIRDLVYEHGSDVWFERKASDLLPESLMHLSDSYEKGMDTMDVWFDSGSSWNAVLPHMVFDKKEDRNHGSALSEDKRIISDLVLEGSDQHRGWFQSSLLTSIATQECAPYKTILTHGFLLDEHHNKMSKSLGNVVEPAQVIDGISSGADGKQSKHPAYGADVMRLWVASTDFTGDISLGSNVLLRTSNALRKYRNTLRFMIGCLHDYDYNRDSVSYDDLPLVDKYMLHLIREFSTEATGHYESYSFWKLCSLIANFNSSTLSSFYFEVSKDRLYTQAASSRSRRASQTVLAHATSALLRVMAPILCFTSEEAYRHLPKDLTQSVLWDSDRTDSPTDYQSIFTHEWFNPPSDWQNESVAKNVESVLSVKSAVNRLIETARSASLVSTSMECDIALVVEQDSVLDQTLSTFESESEGVPLQDMFVCANVDIFRSDPETTYEQWSNISGAESYLVSTDIDGQPLQLWLRRAQKCKCPRCWTFRSDAEEHLCKMCDSIVNP